MPQKRIYMDYNATTPLNKDVKAAMIEDLEVYGNASSLHADGREAHARVEAARKAVAELINGEKSGVIFTSCGSESNNTVFETMRTIVTLKEKVKGPDGKALPPNKRGIITSAIEHPCVLNSAEALKEQGFPVVFLPVDEYGKVQMDAYKAALNQDTLLVSIMAANNEIGTIEDIKTLARMAHEAGAFFHTDATQAVGKIPMDVQDLDVDYLTASAHKIYAPKGTGCLYVKPGMPLFPLIHGGHQEEGYRAGTYNNLGILAFGKAAELAKPVVASYGEEMRRLRNRLRDGLLREIPNIKINGHPEDVLPNTLNVSFPGAEGESILLALDLSGIEVSTGSACASGSLDPSHVLMAIGVGPELAHGSIRFSLGWGITEEDVDYCVSTLAGIIARLRGMSTMDSV